MTPRQLTKAPIIEAVVDLDCDMPTDFDLGSQEAFARQLYGAGYPKLQKAFLQAHEIKAKEGQSPEVHASPISVRALQLVSSDGKQLVQVRTNGFSFNRLAPYTTLDDYLTEIERTWLLFVRNFKPSVVRRIQLRFINRWVLPMQDGKVPLERYLTYSPEFKDQGDLVFVSFLHRHSLVDVVTKNEVVIVLTNQPSEAAGAPIILDVSAFKRADLEPGDWAATAKIIESLRALKNKAFYSTLTEECLSLFH